MSRYDPLLSSLSAVDSTRRYSLSFEEIEKILGGSLPASARRWRQWWENPSRTDRHVQAQAWIGAGWKVDQVDWELEIVHFTPSN